MPLKNSPYLFLFDSGCLKNIYRLLDPGLLHSSAVQCSGALYWAAVEIICSKKKLFSIILNILWCVLLLLQGFDVLSIQCLLLSNVLLL